jgi:tetraacyldisaccharide 4'-kinase
MRSLIKICTPILIVLSALFALVAALRNWLYDNGFFTTYRSSLPIICVGNCTIGGTGKTPLVRELVSLLRNHGKRPVVLSRGYGGSIEGPHQVLVSDRAAQVGDEPVLLALDADLPVVVSRSRVKGARYIEERQLGSVIILDDGYQHRSLQRTINVLCLNVADVSAQKKIISGRYLPWGIFRESLRSALRRADLLVFSFRSQLADTSALNKVLLARIPSDIPVLHSSIAGARIVNVLTRQELSPQRIAVVCAIANPEGFILTLKQLGFELDSVNMLADHSTSVAERCARLLVESTLPIVVTEKDLVKIPDDLRNSARIFVTEMSLKLEPQVVLDSVLVRLSGSV